MGILTNYQEIVGCCVKGGMPAEYAADHTRVLDWLGDRLQVAAFTAIALTQLRETEALAVEARRQLDELNSRCEALEMVAHE